jgi:hypothetical protein
MINYTDYSSDVKRIFPINPSIVAAPLLSIVTCASPPQQGRAEFLSLWAGQGIRLARRQPAAALIARLAGETAVAVSRLLEIRD